MVNGISSSRAEGQGLPTSKLSNSANSSWFCSKQSAIFNRISARSAGLFWNRFETPHRGGDAALTCSGLPLG